MCLYEFMIIFQVCLCQIAYKTVENSWQNAVEFERKRFCHPYNKKIITRASRAIND